jgi:aminopeptidase YwaD
MVAPAGHSGGKLVAAAEATINHLCRDIPERPVGSAGNRAATDFFARQIAAFGFAIERSPFTCLDWQEEGADLLVGDTSFPVQVSPYSVGGRATGPLVVVSTVAELAAAKPAGKILLVRGDLTREQLMPKNFTFYNPEQHQQIIHLLETKAPLAIIAATSRNPELAGGIYPFPLIEDGDFDIPSVYMTAETGEKLTRHAGETVSLTINATRIPATGENIVARKGGRKGGRKDCASGKRIVICAHIDAKINTPGALDNATGVTILLLLAELLSGYAGELAVEIVPLNGEDYYAASGHMLYIQQNTGKFDSILLAANCDLAGYHTGSTAYSLYDCPPDVAAAVQQAFASRPDTIAGEQWFQSDHSIFIQQGVPAIAITSERFMELSATITHTPKDRPELVDPARLVHIAQALHDLIHHLNHHQR